MARGSITIKQFQSFVILASLGLALLLPCFSLSAQGPEDDHSWLLPEGWNKEDKPEMDEAIELVHIVTHPSNPLISANLIIAPNGPFPPDNEQKQKDFILHDYKRVGIIPFRTTSRIHEPQFVSVIVFFTQAKQSLAAASIIVKQPEETLFSTIIGPEKELALIVEEVKKIEALRESRIVPTPVPKEVLVSVFSYNPYIITGGLLLILLGLLSYLMFKPTSE